MNNRTKRGFTLIELLAVIIVLAVIMVFAVPTILNSTNTAKKKSFQLYGEKMLDSAMQLYESEKMLDAVTARNYGAANADGTQPVCYNFKDFGTKNTGSYEGFIVVHPSNEIGNDGLNKTAYYIYMTDGSYAFNNIEYSKAITDASTIKNDKTTVNTVKTTIEKPACPPTSPAS